MTKAGAITKGVYLDWKGEPVLVVEKEFFNPGKGAAVVRLKLRGLESGNVLKEVLKTDEQVEEVSVEYKSAQFLYKSGSDFVFMNPHDYEQYEVADSAIDKDEGFVKEGITYQLAFYQGRVIGIRFPKKMTFEVTMTENAVKGNTVTGASKEAELDTGLKVKVPLFIKKGEKIIVNTETAEYVSRQT